MALPNLNITSFVSWFFGSNNFAPLRLLKVTRLDFFLFMEIFRPGFLDRLKYWESPSTEYIYTAGVGVRTVDFWCEEPQPHP